jgi:hypothetical protein
MKSYFQLISLLEIMIIRIQNISSATKEEIKK